MWYKLLGKLIDGVDATIDTVADIVNDFSSEEQRADNSRNKKTSGNYSQQSSRSDKKKSAKRKSPSKQNNTPKTPVSETAEKEYIDEVKKCLYLSGGQITKDAITHLKSLRKELGLSSKRAEQLESSIVIDDTPTKVIASVSSCVAKNKGGEIRRTEEVFKKIIVDKLGIDRSEVSRRSRFKEDLGADSLDLLEIIMVCENEFGISIPDEDTEKIRTVGDAINYLKSHISEEACDYASEDENNTDSHVIPQTISSDVTEKIEASVSTPPKDEDANNQATPPVVEEQEDEPEPTVSASPEDEEKYKSEFMDILEEFGENVPANKLRLLKKMKELYGISDERAKQLEMEIVNQRR